jgi:hypothetical protein
MSNKTIRTPSKTNSRTAKHGIDNQILEQLLGLLNECSYAQLCKVYKRAQELFLDPRHAEARGAAKQALLTARQDYKAKKEAEVKAKQQANSIAVKRFNGELTAKRFPTVEAAKAWVATWCMPNRLTAVGYVRIS